MQNYERLTLDLIGEGLTPKARYEQMKFLLNVYNCYKRAKNQLEDDIHWYGSDHWAHKQSQKIYDILTGKTPCKHERITRVDGLDECLDCGAKNY